MAANHARGNRSTSTMVRKYGGIRFRDPAPTDTQHGNADAMSRRPCRRLGCCTRETGNVQNNGTQSQTVKKEDEVIVRVAAVNDIGRYWTTSALAAAQEADDEL
jgi:hypothetical protein